MMSMLTHPTRHQFRGQRSFTLTELLVVIAIIAVLSTLTLIGVRSIARSARISSATNAVTAALDNARAIAMRDNKLVLVAFRARPISDNRQIIEIITAEFTGMSYSAPSVGLVDRFVPVQNVAVRDMPQGIKVAGPGYGGGGGGVGAGTQDDIWEANSDFPGLRAGEAAGPIFGVLFSADGTSLTDNPRTGSTRIFVDFNNDGFQRQGGVDVDNIVSFPAQTGYCDLTAGQQFFCQAQIDDEPYITFVPFLAVFDDDQAREQFDTSLWSNGLVRSADLTAFIADNANRIHFNRYTGVVMK